LWKSILIVAKDLVWSAFVEQWQQRAVPADLDHVFDQTVGRLFIPLFSLKTFAKRINYGLS